jgi:iron(III) transport system ATP-binding protein
VSEIILGLEGVGHSYDGVTEVVSGFSLGVGAGEIVCLLGPSGCGKSTVLRLAAGLEPLQKGRIKLRGEMIAEGESRMSEPPERRNVGLVFQDFALFPHLTVARNVGFGLTGVAEDQRSQRVQEALGQVGMGAYLGAYPHALSGGQQQRVALARALAPQPSVMLRVLKRSGAATLLVTHDPEEAMFMADRIYLMQAGKLIQSGPPAEVYARPNSEFSAKFFSNINELQGVVADGVVATPLGLVPAPGQASGLRVKVLFRPESLDCAPMNGATGRVVLPATVTEVRFIGVARLIRVLASPEGGPALDLQVRTSGGYAPEVGAKVGLSLDPAQAFVFGPA